MQRTREQLESAKGLALKMRRAISYALLCDELEVSEHAVEDYGLYEEGHRLIAIENSSPRLSSGDSTLRADDSGNSFYAQLARVALRRFPSGHVSLKELRQRASQINRAGAAVGYHLRHYSALGRDELFAYLTGEVRKDVYGLAREHCSNVVDVIKKENAERKLLEILGR